MRSVLAAFAALALTVGPALAQLANPAQVLADRIDRDGQGVGIAAALLTDGEPAFFSHGVRQVGANERVDETTVFEVGSITKLFTNLLLAQLVLEGKIALDQPITRYLPEGTVVPEFEGKAITALDLATHSSGLPSIPPDIIDPIDPYAGYGDDQLFAFLADYPLPYAPGTVFQYSNTGLALLGAAISHTADKPYDELVAKDILEPLGMDQTSIALSADAPFASPHDSAGAPIQPWHFETFAPAGAYRSTAEDLAIFIAAASGQMETPLREAFDLMLAQSRPAGSPNMTIGLGWMILDQPEGRIVWHNGMTGGSNAFIGFDPDSGRGAVVLSNQITQTGIEDIGFHLIDPDLPLSPQVPPREAVTIDPDFLPRYTGRYRVGPEFILTVSTEGGKLFVQATGQERLEVFPASETEFFYRAVDAQISFEMGKDSKVTALVLHQNGQDMRGERL